MAYSLIPTNAFMCNCVLMLQSYDLLGFYIQLEVRDRLKSVVNHFILLVECDLTYTLCEEVLIVL